VCAMSIGHNAKILGYKTLGEIYEHPKVWLQCNKAAMEMYQFYTPPLALAGAGPLMMGAWGSKFMYPYAPKMGSFTLIEAAVKTPEDAEKVELPDPAPFMGPYYETMELALGQGWYPLAPIMGGWISAAGYSITEPETILFWTIKEPDLVHKLLDVSADYAIRWAELLVEKFGADAWIPWDPNPTDSNTLVDAEMFAKFPLPRAIKVHQKVLDMGVPLWFTHWCSEHKLNIQAGHIEKVPMGDPGILSFGPEVPIEQQVERWGKDYIIIGNVDPPAMMTQPFEEVFELCRKNIEAGMKASRGYMLACGCELPPPTPPANVYAMTKAAREFGRYQ
ncbi:MAG: uroporphyrinogen decarboxylase family protein, partial [Candidatus Hodarchaeota archaeon]